MLKAQNDDSIFTHQNMGSRYDHVEYESDQSPDDFSFAQNNLTQHPGPGGNPDADINKGQFRFMPVHQWEADDNPDKKQVGMECFGTTLMFILQSYGLVDPEMTREQFEETYTPIFGEAKIKYDADDVFTSRYKWYAKHSPGRLAKLSPEKAAINAVRGIKPRDIVSNSNDLKYYLDAFAKMKATKEGGIWATAYANTEFKTEDLSKKLNGKTLTGQMDTAKIDSHLAGGDTIYAGICLDTATRPAGNPIQEYLEMGHRVLIKEKLPDISVFNTSTMQTETIAAYKADDAWYGVVAVFEHRLPKGGKVNTSNGQEDVDKFVQDYKGVKTIHTFSRDAFAASRIKKDDK